LKVLKIVGAIVVCLILLLVVLRFTGFEPKDCVNASTLPCRAPGLWLKGQTVTTPVADWSFTDKVQAIKVQTQTPLLLPYSVSAWCAVYNGNLYLTSYRGRRWVENIVRDPHVGLKIGGQVFDTTFSLVDDPAEKAGVLQAKGQKYPRWKVPAVSTATVFRVMPD
jgi:ribosomal protein S19